MKIAAISDVHVKSPSDEADRLLVSFLNHPTVIQADYIVLLGDIFDLMCGPHEEYLRSFKHLFSALTDLQASGKRIYFFEGNHDIHLEKLFKKLWKNNEVTISQKPIIEEIDGRKYYFSHGDEHEVDNLSYQRYIGIIRSFPVKYLANHFIPLSLLEFFGKRASKMSRKKGSRKFDAEGVRNRFRSGVTKTTQGRFDFVLGGHSHVKDEFIIPGSNSIYVNNGYALQSKSFILIEDHQVKFISLS